MWADSSRACDPRLGSFAEMRCDEVFLLNPYSNCALTAFPDVAVIGDMHAVLGLRVTSGEAGKTKSCPSGGPLGDLGAASAVSATSGLKY